MRWPTRNMNFTPVDPAVKEKIITLHLAGQGRNAIDRELKTQGIKVSHGSISNVINRHKQQHKDICQNHAICNEESIVVQDSALSPTLIQPNDDSTGTSTAGINMTIGAGSPLLSGTGKVVTSNANSNSRVTTFPEETSSDRDFKDNKDISIVNHIITNTQDFEKNGYSSEDIQGQGRKGLGPPLNWFTNGFSCDDAVNSNLPELTPVTNSTRVVTGAVNNNSSELVPDNNNLPKPETTKKVYPRNPILEERFDIERKAWEYCGKTQDRFLNQIREEKLNMKHEERMDERRKQKLNEWQRRLEQRESNLNDREARNLEIQPYLPVAKKLQEMKLTLNDIGPWVQMIEEVAQTQKITIEQAAISVEKDLSYYQQLGGVQRQIERSNQELVLINMAMIQKQKAVKVVEGLLNHGISESQIINFFLVQQPNNKDLRSDNGQKTDINQNPTMGQYLLDSFASRHPGNMANNNNNNNNGYGSGPSTNDLIRDYYKLNLNKMGPG